MPALRYVILRHEGIERPHFDLMFETAPGSQLATWRSDVWPIESSTHVERLADHRAAYLSYEGPVSGNRGQVRRVASGSCLITLAPPGQWVIQLMPAGRLLVLHPVAGDRWEIAAG
ncbi:MAG: hypothetical protein ABSH20_25460, partial [Tepidisphaeraceae bacterium]